MDRADCSEATNMRKERTSPIGRCPSSPSRDSSVLPPAAELWAWAHVHFNQGLSPNPSTELVSPDMSAVLPRVQAILNSNPDLAYSRLLCPRLLDVNTGYDAFVIPAFESGRLAGLGHDPDKSAVCDGVGVGALWRPAGAAEFSVLLSLALHAPVTAATSAIW